MPSIHPDTRDPASILSSRQKEILRLLLRGHDAKSVARLLGLSIHTVNEHLRDARRSLRVSSSREAARMLLEAEGAPPNVVGDERFGVVSRLDHASSSKRTGESRSLLYLGGAAIMMSIAALVIALSSAPEGLPTDRAAPAAQPRVVATTPESGATIRAGQFLLRVTFDRLMLDGSYSFVQVSPDTYPECEDRPTRSRDGRTFTLRCTARAGRQYEVWFNRPPYMNFKSLQGVPAEPFRLIFAAPGR